ncbi:unnamed protein product [Phytomonas sp. Hart1]|nr:unnamed protein product [Phytomonas sp. Hart1]|eukprot:CCW67101.1 unnamed protein product [Phytomonas sp. isolate Hart1]
MSSSNTDGDIAEVNPGLLELSKDPKEWREQRRRAMKERIFGHPNNPGSSAANSDILNKDFIPRGGTAFPTFQTVRASDGDGDCAEQEAFILKQILCRKRQREQREKDIPLVEPATDESSRVSSQLPELSVKEKLLQKYKTPSF